MLVDDKKKEDQLWLGAHTSAQGGPHNALIEGKRIGATTIQLFTANQKTWNTKDITDEQVRRWKEELENTGIEKVMSHDSYLINLGSPREEVLYKSCEAFEREIRRCHRLGVSFLTFHPGMALEDTAERCLDTIADSLLRFEPLLQEGDTRLLIETMAGQGSSVCYRFEQLRYLINRVGSRIPVGVCMDTCHIFAAGYDISSPMGWDQVLHKFDCEVGLKHLYALHVNDSLKVLGSRVDRHAPLGEGHIGIKSFESMMRHPLLRHLPKYLETPGGPSVWLEEIKQLRKFAVCNE